MSTELERDLNRTLERHAEEFAGAVDLADVRARAHELRRRTRRRWATGLAAAAVLAVAVPAALLLPGEEGATPVDPSPTPTVAPDKLPEPTPTTTPPSPTGDDALSQLPAGTAPNWPYLHDGRVQLADGGTAKLPGSASAVVGFASYKGGWLVADDDTATTTWYDAQGREVAKGRGLGIRTSDDGTQVAFLMDDKVHLGGRSSMGEGDQTWPAPAVLDGLAGFVRDGLMVTVDADDVRLLRWDGKVTTLPEVFVATAASQGGNLVGGLVDRDTGGVVDLSTGTVLWQEGWRPLAFSPDGSLVAAVPLADNGDPSELALLDARTGATVARAPLVDNRIYLRGRPVWEDDTHALFVADTGPTAHEAILRLGTETGLERATPAVPGGLTTIAPYVLAAGR